MDNYESNTTPAREVKRNRAIDLLARHLIASPRFLCPGMDGATVAEVVASEYPRASAAGWVPSTAELAARYPDLAFELAKYDLA